MSNKVKIQINGIARLWGYYAPSIRRQVILTAVLTLLCYLCMQLGIRATGNIALYSLIVTLTAYIYYCGGLLFATGRTRVMEAQLPVTALSRTIFALAYIYVLIPGVMLVVWEGSQWILELCGNSSLSPECWVAQQVEDQTGMKASMLTENTYKLPNMLQQMFMAMACLYISVRAKRNAVLYGILAVICAQIALGFIGGICGLIHGFYDGASSYSAHGAMPDPNKIVADVMDFVFKLQLWIGILCGVCIVIGAWLTYRYYRIRNI